MSKITLTQEILTGVIILLTTTSLGLIGWTSKNLYTINRELGTVRNKTHKNSKDISELEERVYEYLYDKQHKKQD